MNRFSFGPFFNSNLVFFIFFLIFIFAPRLFFGLLFLYFLYTFLRSQFNLPSINKITDNWKNKFSEFNFSKTTKSADFVKTQPSSSSPNTFIPMNNFRFNKMHWLITAVIAVVVFIIIDGLVSVPAGHVAVIYDRGRGVLEESLPEGLHLKIPFWQVASLIDTRLQTYTMSIATSEGEKYGNDSIESLTKDGQKVYVDISIQYRIKPNNASWIYKEVGLDFIEKVIRPGVRNVVRDVVTGYDSTKLFTQETRQEAQSQMKKSLEKQYVKNKIQLEDVLLRNIQFSDVYLQAIEDKQVAQQRIQKAEYEKQEAEKIKEKKIIEAEAEAEAIRLKGETLRANPQVIQFEFVQKMAPNVKWGVLPDDVMPLLDFNSLSN